VFSFVQCPTALRHYHGVLPPSMSNGWSCSRLSLNGHGETRRGPSPPEGIRGGSKVGSSSRHGMVQGITSREVLRLGRALRPSSGSSLAFRRYSAASSAGRTCQGAACGVLRQQKGRPEAALDTLYQDWVWFFTWKRKGGVPRTHHRGTLSPGEAPGPPRSRGASLVFVSDHPQCLWIYSLLSKGITRSCPSALRNMAPLPTIGPVRRGLSSAADSLTFTSPPWR
jgi:hypothetical protein